ncbi:Na(+)-translocating NADH-quinone reductase subunit C [Croceiramulus getboli]|nr:Na(+)-translocating NADH-quinone reductase subunit C [Flavobacteriaceae bacterium YJPT1-3]
MAIDTEKNGYTIVFAVIMVMVVGSLLAFIASSLKPTITVNQKLEKQQNILYAMGVNENEGESSVSFVNAEDVAEEFDKYITKQYVIQGDQVTEDPEAYLIELQKEEAKAKDPNYQQRLPLMIGEKDGKTFYIVPMRGKGLWDAIWGFVALDEEMVIQGVYFDHKGETPGLGANIKERYFMDDFIGERILDKVNPDRIAGVTVAKGNNDPKNLEKEDNEVDALAGATITGDGITAMMKKYLPMYVPAIKNIKA